MASGEEGLFDFLPEQAVPERVGGGLSRLRFAERMQTRWRPASLDGLLPDDHRVRLVWSFVEGLDVTAPRCWPRHPWLVGPCGARLGAARRRSSQDH